MEVIDVTIDGKSLGAADVQFEQWKPLPEMAEPYEVSNFGQVRNAKKILKQQDANGYRTVQLIDNKGRQWPHRVHRLVASQFVDNPYFMPEVNHVDGNRSNNHYTNLEWVDRTQNNVDKVERAKATKTKQHDVDDKQILLALTHCADNELTLDDVAESFGLDKTLLQSVLTGKSHPGLRNKLSKKAKTWLKPYFHNKKDKNTGQFTQKHDLEHLAQALVAHYEGDTIVQVEQDFGISPEYFRRLRKGLVRKDVWDLLSEEVREFYQK